MYDELIPTADTTLAGTVPVSLTSLAAGSGIDASQAECNGASTSLFFSDDLDDIAAAKRLCLSCPLRRRCLDAAVDRGEQYGIWGGHLFVAGRIVLSKRRRGRPPKSPRPNDVFPEVDVPERYRELVSASA